MAMRRRLLILTVVALAATVALGPPAIAASLERGDRSNLVTHLQMELADIGFYRGAVDGAYGPQTAQAVMAFHKHLGLPRSFAWQADDWRHLETFPRIPHAGEERVEVDLDRQVLYYHRAGGDVAVVPISSANGEVYEGRGGRPTVARTPEGEFRFQRHIPAMRVSYLGALWKPWYFSGGYAVHGSSSVPANPASHGCIRVPNWEADWLSEELFAGMPLTIGRSGTVEAPSPPPMPERVPTPVLAGRIS